MRPASGPPTLMWRWPARLVAAIFQPTTEKPLAAGSCAWMAWPCMKWAGRTASGSASMTLPSRVQRQSRRAASSAASGLTPTSF